MTSWTFERVAGPFGFTEGPVWDGRGVLFSDLEAATIRRYDRETAETSVLVTETRGANGLTFGPEGQLYACEDAGRQVSRYRADSSTATVVDSYGGDPLNSPNDLAFDGAGGLWFTDPRYGDDADCVLDHRSVYRVGPAGDLTRVTRDTTQPNGVAVAADGETVYVAQSDYAADAPTELRAYERTGPSALGSYAVLHDFHPHRGVDGMCLTERGSVVACAGSTDGGPGPAVYEFDPDGTVVNRHPVPGEAPTNCAFGGPSLSELYVCTHGGDLYRAETDRTGLLGAPASPVLPAP